MLTELQQRMQELMEKKKAEMETKKAKDATSASAAAAAAAAAGPSSKPRLPPVTMLRGAKLALGSGGARVAAGGVPPGDGPDFFLYIFPL
jgi:mevalonate pyrophosphate decarboxylase